MGRPKRPADILSLRTKLGLWLIGVAVGGMGIYWVAEETKRGIEREAWRALTATAVGTECLDYYARLNQQLERQGLPPFATGSMLKDFCRDWATQLPGGER